MRRTLPLLVTATLLFAACSSSDDNASDRSSNESATTDEESETTETSDAGTDTSSTEVADTVPAPSDPEKPDVEIPSELPTELQVTVIEEGTGPAAESGDTVFVDYVGVRSRDGVEFDSSYNRRQPDVPPSPFDFILGQQRVIAGWDQGLEGAQAGSRVQLDIPGDLAYGAEGSGDIIGENEALTFLIDVRAVIQPADPADAPTEPGVPASEGATETTSVDLVEGEGTELEAGQTGVINYVLFRGDNGVLLESSWEAEPVPVPTAEGGFPGFVNGLPGMKVGGRRAIIIPPEDAFGPEGNPQLGLPAGTDMIIVVDLLGVYGQPDS